MDGRPYAFDDDPVIHALRAEGEADPDVIGIVLLGSRSIGVVTDESDYDVAFIVTDEAMERYEQEDRHPVRGLTMTSLSNANDIWNQPIRSVQAQYMLPWHFPTWADSRVIYDRTGETTAAADAVRRIPEEEASKAIADSYDAYLNGMYRSLKSWRRGNELGGRLEAAESADPLLRMLFALERHWRPFSSRLYLHFNKLDGQGWEPGEVRGMLLDLISTGEPRQQQNFARRVTTLMRERGYGHVYDNWDGQIERALAWDFD